MFKSKQEIIAAARMFLSERQLVSLIKVSGKSPVDTADALIKENRLSDKNLILELDALPALTGEGLRIQINEWMSGRDRLPVFVSIKGIGAYAVSSYAGEESSKRMCDKVVIVTGGAQGFGAGLAASFNREGANVVIADLNEETGNRLIDDLNSNEHPGRAIFVQTDVSDYSSVEKLIDRTVSCFGGLDVMISNAGILRAGGLDEMTPEVFSLMTKVNYEGYFNCVKASAYIMKFQAGFTNKYYFDILQINSKSGLKGSNRNFAYAGGKFGGIGLTQSFALELMPYRIKVNSICPGNFFEGPLWSHPETGLFVQYLNAGKVPGAMTLEEVKKFYEQQVPAGRGCKAEDVAKAAFYAIEQEYETGQAIPVTGGQNMLH